MARDEHNNRAIKKTRFEVTDDPERCTLHLINEGVSVRGDSARVEFAGRGPANGYLCHLDKHHPTNVHKLSVSFLSLQAMKHTRVDS